MILSILAKVALGAFLGGVIGAFATGDWIYTIVWTVGLSAFILFALLAGLSGSVRSRRTGWPEGNGIALARVETAQRTGREVVGSQEIDVRLTIAPPDATAYATTTRLTVAPTNLRIFSPGAVIVVSRLGKDRPDVILVPSPTPEWAALVEKAEADPSLIPPASTVPAWETATTTTPGTLRPGRRRSVGSTVIAIAIIVASAALTLYPAYGSLARTATNVATGNWDGNSMLTGSYQQLAVDEIVGVVGGSEFVDIYFYNDYVIATAPTAPGSDHADSYMWRYGRAFREGPELIQPLDMRADLFDISALDFSMVATVVEASIAQAGIDDREYVLAYVVRGDDGPVINVSISGAYDDAHYTWDFDGNDLTPPVE